MCIKVPSVTCLTSLLLSAWPGAYLHLCSYYSVVSSTLSSSHGLGIQTAPPLTLSYHDEVNAVPMFGTRVLPRWLINISLLEESIHDGKVVYTSEGETDRYCRISVVVNLKNIVPRYHMIV